AMYRPEQTVLVASGNVTMPEMEAIAMEMLGTWPRGTSPPPLPVVTPSWNADILRIDRDLTQANLVWGHVGTTRDDPDWYAIQVMNYILGGGGFSSRMMKSVRIEAGLAYSVYSYFRPGKLPGSFQVGLQTKSESTARAIELIEKEIERIRTKPVSEEELSDAKKYLTGSFPLKLDSNGELVAFYSQVEYYGLGLDYPDRHDDLINAVTREDVLRVANEYLRPDRPILVVVGKQAEIVLPGS
ncbi:MAG: M16 family metallopeptidase, partial [Candidatus Binatia bacterium]